MDFSIKSCKVCVRFIFLAFLQGLWLLPAYYLEFEGKNTYFWIWLAGLLFFSINLYVMYVVIDSYQWLPWKRTDSEEPSKYDSLRRKPLMDKRFEKCFQKKDKMS